MLGSSLALSAFFSLAPPAKAEVLPLSRLHLCETGVGDFERRGRVSFSSAVSDRPTRTSRA